MNERWQSAKAWINQANGPWGNGGGDSGSDGDSGGDSDPRNPWSQPPGNGGKRPKGSRGSSALDELMRQLRGYSGGGFPGGGAPGTWRKYVAVVAILWLTFGSFTRITPEEQGVVTVFGKYAYTLNPGISLTPPWPVGSVDKVNVQANNKIDLAAGKDERNFILTADQNIIDLGYQVRWNVKDARNYSFQLSNTDDTIKEVSESAMREVLGNVTFIDAMGSARAPIERKVAIRMQELLNDYKAGVNIQGVSIMKAGPPEEVRDAFNEVTAAQQNRQTSINKARAYAQQVTSNAEGAAQAFDKVYAQYRLSPVVTRRRMYYETMEQILSRTNKTIVEPGSVAPYLPIGKPKQQQETITVEGPAR